MKFLIPMFCCSLIVVFGPRVEAQTQYTLLDLGTLGGDQSSATAINIAGQVAGSSVTSENVEHAFRTAANRPIDPATDDLGTLGGATSTATAMNASGEVIGLSETAGAGQTHSFRTAANRPIDPATDDLGTLGGSRGLDTIAHGIDAAGRVVGESAVGQSAQSASNILEPFRTGPNAPIHPGTDNLSALIPNAIGAAGMNSLGHVVGTNYAGTNYTGTSANYPNGYLLKDGAVTDLGSLGIGGVAAINDSDQVAMNSNRNATLWANGARTTISETISAALAINNRGQVVGFFTMPDQMEHAYIYTSGTLYDLNSLVPSVSGLVIRSAAGINDAGQIAATALIQGHTHAVLLTPAATSAR